MRHLTSDEREVRAEGFTTKLIVLSLGLAVATVLLWMATSIGGDGRGHVNLDLAEPASAAAPDPASRAEASQAVSVPAQVEAEPAPAPPAVPKTTVLTVKDGASVELVDKPGGKPVVTLGDETEFGSPTVLTVVKRKGIWAGVPTHLLPNGRLGWVRIGSNALKTDRIGVRVVVDLSDRRARLLRGGRTERKWQIGVGAPDSPTPTGSFSITDKLEGADINPVYGCCALALSATQPNVPEGWTGGNRMAIHGPSGPLGQELSAGCVWSADEDLQVLMERAPLGTPVEIRR